MDFAAHLKSVVDIVKVIGAYVPLKKRGANSYIGLCPFHSEKSPSFNVHPTQQFYKCFGCGAGGDVFKFVMEYEKVTFPEAIASLAEQFGVPLPEKKQNFNDPEARLRTAVLAMHELAAKVFQQSLAGPAGADARAYLERRKLPLARAAEFGVGFSERSGQGLTRVLKAQGFAPNELEESGLVTKRDDGSFFDKFRGRLMFPIHNEGGKVIAFGGRALYEGDEPKYLNSPGTPIYTKSLVLYHLHRAREAARKTGRLVLVEGYMDVIGAWAAGVKEAVAPCGTALTPQQVKVMSKYAPLVVVNFDPDNAGANAAEKSIAILLEEHMRVRIATLEGGLDPDEYVAAHGPDAYLARLDKAQNYFHWLAGRAQQRFDVKTAEGKVQALEFLLPAIRRVQDPMERASLAAELANRLGVEQAMLLDQFRRMAVQRTEQRLTAPTLDLSPSEKVLLQLLLQSPEVCEFAAPVLLDDERLEHFALTSSPAWPLWQKVLSQAAEGPLNFSALEEQLNAAEKTLMATLVFADRTADEQEAMMQAAACLAQFAAAGRRSRINELKRQIRTLEQTGSLSEALAITEELYALERQEKA
jgi:DNA primase